MPATAARFHWHWQSLMDCNARLVHKHKETVLNKATPSWSKHKITGLIHALLAAAWPGEGPVPNAHDTSHASASSPWQALASAELLRASCALYHGAAPAASHRRCTAALTAPSRPPSAAAASTSCTAVIAASACSACGPPRVSMPARSRSRRPSFSSSTIWKIQRFNLTCLGAPKGARAYSLPSFLPT